MNDVQYWMAFHLGQIRVFASGDHTILSSFLNQFHWRFFGGARGADLSWI
jgi:hypothetical protein